MHKTKAQTAVPIEMQLVAERIGDSFRGLPRRLLQTRPGEAVISADQLAMKCRDVLDLDAQRRCLACRRHDVRSDARRSRRGRRHVERRVVVEAMLPLDLETEEADIELTRLGNVEDAQDGRDGAKFRHGAATVRESRRGGSGRSLFQLQQPFEIAAFDVGAERIAEPLADRFAESGGRAARRSRRALSPNRRNRGPGWRADGRAGHDRRSAGGHLPRCRPGSPCMACIASSCPCRSRDA